ncbi:MAG: DNA polymerase III subunit delta' C-terminal domain-containing protein [Legionellales bacterium]
MTHYKLQWDQLHHAWVRNRLPQAILLVGPMHCGLVDFTTDLLKLTLCQNKSNAPCLECPDCHMVARVEHPDMEWVKPEKSGGAIKIDQVRELQSTAYLTPKRAKHRLVVIEAADRMNTASANALLKILEEPAKHTIFVLIAQQLSTVLPTVLSRCCIIRFASLDTSYTSNLLKLGEQYPQDSERAIIIGQSEALLDELIALIEHRTHPCALAARWAKFEMDALLWFLYLVFAQLQNMQFTAKLEVGPAVLQLTSLSSLLNFESIFNQIDKINAMTRKLSHNMNVNHTLVLEDMLFALRA